MNDYWVDGHHVTASSPAAALDWVQGFYGYLPNEVREWTADDQIELDGE